MFFYLGGVTVACLLPRCVQIYGKSLVRLNRTNRAGQATLHCVESHYEAVPCIKHSQTSQCDRVSIQNTRRKYVMTVSKCDPTRLSKDGMLATNACCLKETKDIGWFNLFARAWQPAIHTLAFAKRLGALLVTPVLLELL